MRKRMEDPDNSGAHDIEARQSPGAPDGGRLGGVQGVGSGPDSIPPQGSGCARLCRETRVPCMLAFWLPLYVPTTRFPAMGFPELPLGPHLGPWYRLLTYQLIRKILMMMSKRVTKWRRRNGLDPRSPGFRMRLPDGRPIPALHGFSRHMIPRPKDWPETAIVTGFWFLNQAEDWNPPRPLTEFLSRGEPPVYFGFGSIFGRDPGRVTQTILEAIPAHRSTGDTCQRLGGS